MQHRYNEIIEWWRTLAEENSHLVTYVKSVGQSYEGRDQPAVHITASSDPNVNKVFFECQTHASKTPMLYTTSYVTCS